MSKRQSVVQNPSASLFALFGAPASIYQKEALGLEGHSPFDLSAPLARTFVESTAVRADKERELAVQAEKERELAKRAEDENWFLSWLGMSRKYQDLRPLLHVALPVKCLPESAKPVELFSASPSISELTLRAFLLWTLNFPESAESFANDYPGSPFMTFARRLTGRWGNPIFGKLCRWFGESLAYELIEQDPPQTVEGEWTSTSLEKRWTERLEKAKKELSSMQDAHRSKSDRLADKIMKAIFAHAEHVLDRIGQRCVNWSLEFRPSFFKREKRLSPSDLRRKACDELYRRQWRWEKGCVPYRKTLNLTRLSSPSFSSEHFSRHFPRCVTVALPRAPSSSWQADTRQTPLSKSP
jgi:hypothetical protein